MNNDAANDEFAGKGDVVADADEDHRVAAWLNSRMPAEVPSGLTIAVRSAMAAELVAGGPTSSADACPAKAVDSAGKRRRPSLGVVTAALVVLTIGLNIVVAWRSDRQIAAVVGNDGGRASVPMNETDESATRRISVAALFEFNASLIQRELNHERVESTRIGVHERRQSARPTEEGHPKEVPDRSGAAVGPGSGIQRRSKLASFVTA